MSRSKADGTLDPALGAASGMNLPVPTDSRFGNHGPFARRGPRPAGTFARSDHGGRRGGARGLTLLAFLRVSRRGPLPARAGAFFATMVGGPSALFAPAPAPTVGSADVRPDPRPR